MAFDCLPFHIFAPDVAPNGQNMLTFHTTKHAVISESPSQRLGASSGCGWKNCLQYGGQLRIYLITIHGQQTGGDPPGCGMGEL